ncbi:MAG: hypothetical protein Q9167_004823 [Letrouitia subvulpina]
MSSDEEARYQPKDAINATIKGTTILGFAGLLISAAQNTLARRNVTGWGVFTRSGGTIVGAAAFGGSFSFFEAVAANLREKDDSYNPAIGGFAAGAVAGFRFRSFPAVLGLGALVSVLLGTFDYTGGKLSGYGKDKNVDWYEYKEQMRKDRRRPIEETLQELGEGRGIQGPGYQQRRRETIKQRYGIEVP